MKKVPLVFFVLLVLGCGSEVKPQTPPASQVLAQEPSKPLPSTAIENLRKKSYPGSAFVLDQKLKPGINYERSVVSYQSDGLKIYGLLTVPQGKPPQGGWPVIVFNHGHIPPAEYKTTERYVAYQDAFARQGYITFKSDYRGHGRSEGQAQSPYFYDGYLSDVLNAAASLRKLPEANPRALGFWGHSMGGTITVQALLVDSGIKAADIWGGVIGSFVDMEELGWSKRWKTWRGGSKEGSPVQVWESWTREQGAPVRGAYTDFWKAVDPTEHLKDVKAPVLLQHGLSDETVPWELSQRFHGYLKALGKDTQLATYPGDDHNISKNLVTALNRSVAFFDKHLKTLKE